MSDLEKRDKVAEAETKTLWAERGKQGRGNRVLEQATLAKPDEVGARNGGLMRKVMAVAVALVAALAIAGCGNTTYAFEDFENRDRFSCESGWASIVTDTRTGVQYLAWKDYNKGGICVLVDRDGKPLVKDSVE